MSIEGETESKRDDRANTPRRLTQGKLVYPDVKTEMDGHRKKVQATGVDALCEILLANLRLRKV